MSATTDAMRQKQPWLYSAAVDSALIISPAFLSVAVVWLLRGSFDGSAEVPLWAWVCFILCIDVAHVYSTLFRTYFDPTEFQKRKTLLTVTPLLAWLGGALLYTIDDLLFWRILAYVAVFHFIRQQYGFMMLYSRKESAQARKFKWVDKSLIYLATLYPIVYWHTHLPRNFHWFMDGDFFQALPKSLERIALAAYAIAIFLYLVKEIALSKAGHPISIPKQLIVLGTALSWYIGIVALNGDMAFTITNVISHGIPYIGLIWIYGRKRSASAPDLPILGKLKSKHVFSVAFLPAFAGILILLAYAEEGLWAGLVWREHLQVFGAFAQLPKMTDHATLAWLIPLLAVPQLTHYIIDGFIWKLRDGHSTWQQADFRTRAIEQKKP